MGERSPKDNAALTSFMGIAGRQRERTHSSSPGAAKAFTGGKGQEAAEPLPRAETPDLGMKGVHSSITSKPFPRCIQILNSHKV